MKEEWKVIEEFKDYSVSNLGRVKRIGADSMGRKLRVLKFDIDKRLGYFKVHLYKNKKAYSRLVHRLVAIAFLPNPLGLPQVNHKKEKSNNKASQLEWISWDNHRKDVAKRGQKGLGVTFDTWAQKWRAYYQPLANTQVRLGSFSTRKEAEKARQRALSIL